MPWAGIETGHFQDTCLSISGIGMFLTGGFFSLLGSFLLLLSNSKVTVTFCYW